MTDQLHILNVQAAKYYGLAFKNGLVMTGAEEGAPQYLGNDKQWSGYEKDLKNLDK